MGILRIQPEIARQKLSQKLRVASHILQFPSFHHLLHRPPEVGVRVHRVFPDFMTFRNDDVVGLLGAGAGGVFENGVGATGGGEEEAAGGEDGGKVVGDGVVGVGGGGEEVVAVFGGGRGNGVGGEVAIGGWGVGGDEGGRR